MDCIDGCLCSVLELKTGAEGRGVRQEMPRGRKVRSDSLLPWLSSKAVAMGWPHPSTQLTAPVRQPSQHSSCARVLSGFLGLGTVLLLVLSSHLLTPLYIISFVSFSQITWLDSVIRSPPGPERKQSCSKDFGEGVLVKA